MKSTLLLTGCGLFMMLRNIFLALVLFALPVSAAESLKAVGAVAKANVKAVGAVAEANIKAVGAVDNTAAGGPTWVFQETFDGAGYDLSWTESSGTPNEDYDEGGQECVELFDEGTNETTDSPTFTADTDGMEVVCRIMIKALPAGTETVITIRNSTSSPCSAQLLASGAWRLSMTGGNSASTVSTMSLDTWYDIYMFYDAGAGTDAVGKLAWIATGSAKPSSGNNFTTKTDSTATLGGDNIRLGMPGLNGRVVFNDAWVDDVAITSSPF